MIKKIKQIKELKQQQIIQVLTNVHMRPNIDQILMLF
jgi:hypothetical protein